MLHLHPDRSQHVPITRVPVLFFFFKDAATTELYTLSLHDALPIWPRHARSASRATTPRGVLSSSWIGSARSEEHTSELQSHSDLVCRLLLEKKKKTTCHRNAQQT